MRRTFLIFPKKSSKYRKEKENEGGFGVTEFWKVIKLILRSTKEKNYIHLLLGITCWCVNCKCKLSSSIQGSKRLLCNGIKFQIRNKIFCQRSHSTFLIDFHCSCVKKELFKMCVNTQRWFTLFVVSKLLYCKTSWRILALW